MSILDEILSRKRRDLDEWRVRRPVTALRRQAGERPPPPDFTASLRSVPVALIAEVKRRSPSAGLIRDPFHPAEIARAYERAGARAVSVLIDAPFFGGGEADFREVREAVALPMLYKEFVVDRWQVAHAAAIGASAVLLIVAALRREELRQLSDDIRRAGMCPLVEVHDRAELDLALESGAECIGINNRDLRTFETRIDTTLRLLPDVPASVLAVSESGIRSADDVRRLAGAGVRAVLVGEHLLRQPDLDAAVRGLMSV